MEDNIKYYIAGLLDGEGTITLTKSHSRKEFKTPVVSCSSTTIEFLELLKSNYGGHISKHKVYQDHHKQSWSWKVSYQSAIKVCHDMKTLLLDPTKIHRAKLVSEQYPLVTNRNGKYSEEQRQAKFFFEDQFFHPSASVN
jgi:hypothetical protein